MYGASVNPGKSLLDLLGGVKLSNPLYVDDGIVGCGGASGIVKIPPGNVVPCMCSEITDGYGPFIVVEAAWCEPPAMLLGAPTPT